VLSRPHVGGGSPVGSREEELDDVSEIVSLIRIEQ